MTELLSNYMAGRWQAGTGAGTVLLDPVLGTELVRVDATGLDLTAAFDYARQTGGRALRALSYRQRADLLAQVLAVMQAQRETYYEIALANSGTVKND
jgi:3,4-dehydroadipyl-CoA semialdehyde dehydrogenase